MAKTASKAKKAANKSTTTVTGLGPIVDPKSLDNTIEDDVIAAPRSSRKRAGDFFDFDGEGGNDGQTSSKTTELNAGKTAKKSKTASASEVPEGGKEGATAGESTVSKTGKPTKKSKAPATPNAPKDSNEGGTLGTSNESKAAKPKKKSKTGPAPDAAAKPSKIDGHPVVTEKTQPGGDSVEVEPAETVKSKKGKGAKGKVAKASTEETLPLGGSVGVEPAETVKSGKGKGIKGKVAKPSTEEMDPAGDAIELESEPAEAVKSKKGKGAKGKVAKASTEERDPAADTIEPEPEPVETLKPKKGKGAKGKAKEPSTAVLAKLMTKEPKPKETEEDSTAKPTLEPATIEQDTTKSVEKGKRAKKLKKTEGDSAAPDKADQAPKPDAAKAAKKGNKSKDAKEDPLVPPGSGEAASSALLEKSTFKKPKAASKRNGAKSGEAKSVLESTMDEGPLKTLLEKEQDSIPEAATSHVEFGPSKTRKAKIPSGVAETSQKAPKAAKENNTVKPKEKGKAAKASEYVTKDAEASSKSEVPKSRKRKTPASADADMVKSDLLDPLSEHASSSKKTKKPKISSLGAAGDKLGVLLASGLDVATQSANVAKELALEVVSGAQKSIMGDITEVAEAAVESKKETKPGKDKGKGMAKEDDYAMAGNSGKKLEAEESTEVDPTATGAEEPEHYDDDHMDEDEDDFEEEDQTAALLKGFESDEEQPTGVEGKGFEQGQDVPELPGGNQISEKLEAVKSDADGPGVVYVGRIPHGFYEHEMRSYFEQFGPIKRLRLSRNKTTGQSKHYAFLEFQSASVAKIVADTMNNYLMFGHILKCNFILPGQVHENLWVGANKRFKAVPWGKIEGRKLEMGMGREAWSKRIEGEKKRRADKEVKLQEIGYEFDAGELKGVDEVPVREVKKAVEEGVAGETQVGELVIEEEKSLVVGTIEGNSALIISEEVTTTKKVTKNGKGKAKQQSEEGLGEVVNKALGKGKDGAAKTTKKAKRKSEEGSAVVASKAKKMKVSS